MTLTFKKHLFLAVLGLYCFPQASSSCADGGGRPTLKMRRAGFLLSWLLLLQSTGSRPSGLGARGLSCSVGSSRARDGICVPCIGRQILMCSATREVPLLTFEAFLSPALRVSASALRALFPLCPQEGRCSVMFVERINN